MGELVDRGIRFGSCVGLAAVRELGELTAPAIWAGYEQTHRRSAALFMVRLGCRACGCMHATPRLLREIRGRDKSPHKYAAVAKCAKPDDPPSPRAEWARLTVSACSLPAPLRESAREPAGSWLKRVGKLR